MRWTDELIERVAEKLNLNWTAAQIAADIGVTRNAVIGIVGRNEILRGIGLSAKIGSKYRREKPAKPARANWSDGKIGEIAGMMKRHHTAAEIGAQFGTSRAAVLGLIHRTPALKSLRAPAPQRKIRPRLVRSEMRHIVGRPLYMLSARQCRWCINEPEKGSNGHLFCAEATEPGSSYCDFHAACSVGRGTESERTAHKVRLAA